MVHGNPGTEENNLRYGEAKDEIEAMMNGELTGKISEIKKKTAGNTAKNLNELKGRYNVKSFRLIGIS